MIFIDFAGVLEQRIPRPGTYGALVELLVGVDKAGLFHGRLHCLLRVERASSTLRTTEERRTPPGETAVCRESVVVRHDPDVELNLLDPTAGSEVALCRADSISRETRRCRRWLARGRKTNV